MKEYAVKRLFKNLDYKGLMNIQYIVDGDQVYLLEVNPRASRTVPIVSKVTGVPTCANCDKNIAWGIFICQKKK